MYIENCILGVYKFLFVMGAKSQREKLKNVSLTYFQTTENVSSLVWAEIECTVHVARPKRSVNQFRNSENRC